MAPEDLQRALTLADAAATVREAAAALRAAWPGLRVLVVDAFDLRHETPAARGTKRTLYCGTSDGHCWQLTPDPAGAAALFVAEHA